MPFPDDWPVTACTVTLPGNPLFLDIPDNTVGMVHSHPYSIGEDIGPVCRLDEKVPYQGRASRADIILQVRLAMNAKSKEHVSNLNDFTGVVIDKDGIRITKGGLGLNSELFGQPITAQQILDNTQNEQPCGYQ